MLKRHPIRMAVLAIAGIAWLCFPGCGAEEAAHEPEQPGTTQSDPGGSGAQGHTWKAAMQEGLRGSPAEAAAAHEKQLRAQGASPSNSGDGQDSNCVRAAGGPEAASFQPTTNQPSIPLSGLPVCRGLAGTPAPSAPVEAADAELVSRPSGD
jgi:hypothetical protein